MAESVYKHRHRYLKIRPDSLTGILKEWCEAAGDLSQPLAGEVFTLVPLWYAAAVCDYYDDVNRSGAASFCAAMGSALKERGAEAMEAEWRLSGKVRLG